MELETIGENAGKVWRTLNEMREKYLFRNLVGKLTSALKMLHLQ